MCKHMYIITDGTYTLSKGLCIVGALWRINDDDNKGSISYQALPVFDIYKKFHLSFRKFHKSSFITSLKWKKMHAPVVLFFHWIKCYPTRKLYHVDKHCSYKSLYVNTASIQKFCQLDFFIFDIHI